MTDLTEMWKKLNEYQSYADTDGHGDSWRMMCEERTSEAAVFAAVHASMRMLNEARGAWVSNAARAVALAVSAAAKVEGTDGWPASAIRNINESLKDRDGL